MDGWISFEPAEQATSFLFLLLLLLGCVAGQNISDKVGRKVVVLLISGSIQAAVIFIRQCPTFLQSGFIFGLGYGAYLSVDMAFWWTTLLMISSPATQLYRIHCHFRLCTCIIQVSNAGGPPHRQW
eukprot:GEZU01021104.1.p2 GENE.GEZU01021104.1~~GEZU01021104.1.p2  ORF type:complete len:126 (-),score=21.10 GEZU01021104.1:174-551(-)